MHATQSDSRNVPSPAAPGPSWRTRIAEWVESSPIQRIVMAVIILNAVVLGMETSDSLMASIGPVLRVIDTACLAVFVIEIGLKLVGRGLGFFRSPWNVFDFLVVGIALIPGSGAFAVLRSLRVLRVLRLISVVPQLRKVVSALVSAVPGIASIGLLLSLLFYVGAVMSTELFGEVSPEHFGNLGLSLFTLFQVMTLDNWENVVRPVMAEMPWAPAFFIPFILLSAFTVLNLFIAVIVDAMNAMQAVPVPRAVDGEGAERSEAEEDEGESSPDSRHRPHGAPASGAELAEVHAELRALRTQVAELSEQLRR